MDVASRLRDDFEVFRSECIELQGLVNTHATLFESGDEQDKLLRGVAGFFFDDLSHWLTELYILRVCKLTDPAETGQQDNLTTQGIFSRLPALFPSATTELTVIRDIHGRLLGYRKLLKTARNKRVAHLDLKTSRSDGPLGAHTRKEMLGFVQDLQSFCDEVGCLVGAGPLDYRSTSVDGDALGLVAFLRRCNEKSHPD